MDLRTIFALIALGVYLCVLILIFHKYWKDLKSDAKALLLVSPLVFLIPFFMDYVFPEKLDPDYIALNRPYLEPQLVITETEGSKFRVEYRVKNIGQLPAAGLKFHFKGPGMLRSEFDSPMQRNLAPGSSMRWVPNPIPFKRNTQTNNFLLVARYTGTINDNRKSFHSAFRTLVRDNDIKINNTILYDDSSRMEGEFDVRQLLGHLNSLMRMARKRTGTNKE